MVFNKFRSPVVSDGLSSCLAASLRLSFTKKLKDDRGLATDAAAGVAPVAEVFASTLVVAGGWVEVDEELFDGAATAEGGAVEEVAAALTVLVVLVLEPSEGSSPASNFLFGALTAFESNLLPAESDSLTSKFSMSKYLRKSSLMCQI